MNKSRKQEKSASGKSIPGRGNSTWDDMSGIAGGSRAVASVTQTPDLQEALGKGSVWAV